jgi:uncharacterized protein (TIGR02270 family)
MILSLVEQHASAGAFLWSRREAAVRAPHYTLASLGDLDDRVEAHIDGLRVAGDVGWKVALAGIGEEEAGGMFMASTLAISSGDVHKLAKLLDMAVEDPARLRELVSALGWAPWEVIGPLMPGFFGASNPPVLWRIGLAACAAHRRDPGPLLEQAIYAEDPALRARALRTAGELVRTDVAREVKAELGSTDDGCRFWAAWATAILGDPKAVDALWPFAASVGERSPRAVEVAMRRLDPPAAVGWIKAIGERPGGMRLACIGAASLGEVSVVSGLLAQARQPALARIAAEGIRRVTGIAVRGPLAGKAPEGFQAGPSDDPKDEDVAMDPDEHLPWPNVGALEARCREAMASMQRRTRYLGGRPITPEWAASVLREGTQTDRAAAALELVIQTKAGPLFEVRAPGRRQRAALK